ncbi:VOC family protein [Gulosibacter chungangensis]|uniref:VOC family protein n=1 Tax=Gulosibacter chungangensis TaxID=979746 RepID=A0A7J5B9P7_9MICO|nr:VOC family protein [Gulosibacter chungangensis]KAB1642318.1 VOC family protein [Gulosibacter chungangensis]
METSHAGTSIPTARSVDHIGLTVPDLEEAVAFFTNYLGCQVVWEFGPYGNDGDMMRRQLNVHPEAIARIAFLRMGPTLNLELFEYSAPDQVKQLPKNSDFGGSHLGIYVDDIEVAVEYLRTVPGVVLQDGPNLNTGDTDPAGLAFCYFLTPWGQQMELVSAPAGMGYEKRTLKRSAPPAEYWQNGPSEHASENSDLRRVP